MKNPWNFTKGSWNFQHFLFTTFYCSTIISSTLFSNPNCLYTKPPDHQRSPKFAACWAIDFYVAFQNFIVIGAQSCAKWYQSSKKLIVWPKIFHFFIGVISNLLKSAYFLLFNVWMIIAIWVEMCQNSLLYKTHVAPKSTKGWSMTIDRFFYGNSEFHCVRHAKVR